MARFGRTIWARIESLPSFCFAFYLEQPYQNRPNISLELLFTTRSPKEPNYQDHDPLVETGRRRDEHRRRAPGRDQERTFHS